MKPNLVLALGVLGSIFLLLSGCSQSSSDKDIQLIGIADVRDLITRAQAEPKAMLLLDARSPKAFAVEHLPMAVNMQLYEVDIALGAKAKLKAYKSMVVYGDDAGSPPGKGLTKRLMETGYKDVTFFAGGLKEWNARGFSIETGGSTGAVKN